MDDFMWCEEVYSTILTGPQISNDQVEGHTQTDHKNAQYSSEWTGWYLLIILYTGFTEIKQKPLGMGT